VTIRKAKNFVLKKYPRAAIAPWVVGEHEHRELLESLASMRTLSYGKTEDLAWQNAAQRIKEG